MRVPPDKRNKYATLRSEGYSRAEACRRIGVSTSWAKQYDNGVRNSSTKHYATAAEAWDPKSKPEETPGPKPLGELCPEAKRALEDIGYFALRYFGLLLVPAQVDSVEKALEWANSEDETYVVVNQPPGSGKTTFWASVVPAWMICQRRHIRMMIGSASLPLAKRYLSRLREVLTTTEPIKASPHDLKAGRAVDAEASLCVDFGRFRPEDSAAKWSQEEFIVEQHGGDAYGQKEATCTAFGRESAFIGMRVDVAIWDDVYDPEKMRNVENREQLKRWWNEIAEQRLEPGGLLILQGQRLDPDDIYRYALDETDIEIDDETGELLPGGKPKYHHVIYKAHYDEHCRKMHKRTSPPYDPKHPHDSGCLLYPRRLPWAKLVREKENNPNYETIFNQDDTQYSHLLVDRIWITGGTDPRTRQLFPGCQDTDRELCQIPAGLHGQLSSIATADPSPTRYWAIQWWAPRWAADQGDFAERYLLDLERQVMGANDLLDYDSAAGKFTGLMEEWQMRSIRMGLPITHWIIEANAAQRFLFQYNHFHQWVAARGVNVIQHETHRNKADPQLGVTSIANHYKYGRVRLPYAFNARLTSQKLIDELVRWPKGRTDDCVMANWFLEWNLPYLQLDEDAVQDPWRPSWLGDAAVAV